MLLDGGNTQAPVERATEGRAGGDMLPYGSQIDDKYNKLGVIHVWREVIRFDARLYQIYKKCNKLGTKRSFERSAAGRRQR